jgi:hypothetical protein
MVLGSRNKETKFLRERYFGYSVSCVSPINQAPKSKEARDQVAILAMPLLQPVETSLDRRLDSTLPKIPTVLVWL